MKIKSVIRDKKAILFVDYIPDANSLSKAQAEEFKELALAAGLKYETLAYQVIKKINPASFIGSGKILELKELLQNTQSKVIVFNASLSGVQIRNLETELNVMVIDRDQLILDIFGQRANTYVGKLQVELARTLDELPRMIGAWRASLSRQGGGIGAKGPGEKAIETDRRQVKDRIKKIQQKLNKIRQVRTQHRTLRKKNKIHSVALVGYTNSGKSTLLNSFTKSLDIAVKNIPFMTLDPTTRKVYINNSQQVLITDTVGFIQNLSPHLIEAFKATLEESASADILLHVIDASSPLKDIQIQTVNKLISDFNWDKKPCIYVYNKKDLVPEQKILPNTTHPHIFISALHSQGLNALKLLIEKQISLIQTESVQLYFPKNEENKIYDLSKKSFIYHKESSSLGTLCKVHINVTQLKKWKKFIMKAY